MKKTNWDRYIENLQKDSSTRQELNKASLAIDISMQIYDLRKKRGLTQKELAKILGVKQPNISRLEDADYTGHTLQNLHKIAKALTAKLEVSLKQKELSVISFLLSSQDTKTLPTIQESKSAQFLLISKLSGTDLIEYSSK